MTLVVVIESDGGSTENLEVESVADGGVGVKEQEIREVGLLHTLEIEGEEDIELECSKGDVVTVSTPENAMAAVV